MPYRDLHKKTPCIPDSNPSLTAARMGASIQAKRAMSANTPIALSIPWQSGLPKLLLPDPPEQKTHPGRRCKDPPVQLASAFPKPQLIPFMVSAAPPRCCPKVSVTQLLTFRAMVWRLAPSSVCKEATGIHCPGQAEVMLLCCCASLESTPN